MIFKKVIAGCAECCRKTANILVNSIKCIYFFNMVIAPLLFLLLLILVFVVPGRISTDIGLAFVMLMLWWIPSTIILLIFRWCICPKISRCCCNCGNFCVKTKTNDAGADNRSLEEVLLLLYKEIPSEELLSIILNAKEKHLSQIASLGGIKRVFNSRKLTTLLAGSTAERFNIPISDKNNSMLNQSHPLVSDTDYMIFPEDVHASFYNIANHIFAKIDKIHLKNGYVYLIFNNIINQFLAKNIKEDIAFKGNVASRNLFCCVKGYSVTEKSGPAVKLYSGTDLFAPNLNADIVPCIKCKEWPFQVTDWSERTARTWPKENDVRQIISKGCHIIPKRPSFSKKKTWRISFSEAEVELSKLVPEGARICYLGIKTLKPHLLKVCSKLKSYHLKCIFLYTLESVDPEFWTLQLLENGFHVILDNVIKAVKSKYCPHYWITDVNFFEKFNKIDVRKLTNLLHKIKEKPIDYIKLVVPLEERHENDEEDLEEKKLVANNTHSDEIREETRITIQDVTSHETFP